MTRWKSGQRNLIPRFKMTVCLAWDFPDYKMITFLQGKLVEALPTQVVVDVNGVGYEGLIPLSSFDKLPQPVQPVKLLTQLIVREDAHILYGFRSAAQPDLVRLLVNSVSASGPQRRRALF